MTNRHQPETTARRQRASAKSRRAAGAAETLGARSRPGRRFPPIDSALDPALDPELGLGAGPVAVQVHIGELWIAGEALNGRVGPAGGPEVLVSHHGHLVWVDQQEVRVS